MSFSISGKKKKALFCFTHSFIVSFTHLLWVLILDGYFIHPQGKYTWIFESDIFYYLVNEELYLKTKDQTRNSEVLNFMFLISVMFSGPTRQPRLVRWAGQPLSDWDATQQRPLKISLHCQGTFHWDQTWNVSLHKLSGQYLFGSVCVKCLLSFQAVKINLELRQCRLRWERAGVIFISALWSRISHTLL